MQHKIESDSIGVINKIYIKPGSQLDANDKILEIKNNNSNKIKKMQDCGITIAKSPAEIGKTLLNKLSN